jgi:hypothetical protein
MDTQATEVDQRDTDAAKKPDGPGLAANIEGKRSNSDE